MDELNHYLFMSTDWIFIGVVYAFADTNINPKPRKRFGLYSNTLNGEIVYQARIENLYYHVSKNPCFGAEQPPYSSYTHMILCEDTAYYLNL